MAEIISEEIISQQGSFRRVKRWLRGKHPKLGQIIPPHAGLSGDWETVIECDYILPLFVIKVDKTDNFGELSE